MFFNHRHIRHVSRRICDAGLAVIALAFAVIAPACSSAAVDEPVPPSVQGDYGFALTLSVGDNESFMRSTPTDGEYDPGEGYENYIDLASSDYRIYLFGSNNKLIHAVPSETVTLLPTNNSTSGSKTYELRFFLADIERFGFKPESSTFKMLMLANWRKYPENLQNGVTTIDDLMNSAEALRDYTAPKGALLTADERIPMFGVKLYSGIKLDQEFLTQLDKFHLLRAYSKIEVYGSDLSAAQIKSVELTRYCSQSYNSPILKDYIQSEYVTNSYQNDYGGLTFRPVTDKEIDRLLELKEEGTSGHFFIYVPEFKNVAGNQARPDNERARLLVTYTDDRTDYVEFKYYDEVNASRNGAKKGDFFDLRRNYWYRYELNKGSVNLVMRVDVVPYINVELKPEFGFDDPLPRPPSEWVTPPWIEIKPDGSDSSTD